MLFQYLISWLMYLAFTNTAQAIRINEFVKDKADKPQILWTIDCSPDGNYFAVGGDDGLLRIFETTGLKLSKSYQLSNAIQCLDWHHNGKILAIAMDNKPVQLLNIETEQFVELLGTTGSRALAWNNSGEMLAVGDYNGLLFIWSKEGKLIKTIQKNNTKTYLSIDWHPSRNILLTGGDMIRLFDTSGKLLKSFKHRQEETIILTVKWHPGGTFFASGDYGHKEEGIESLLQFWKEDGTLIKSLHGSKAEYRNIRWSKDGLFLATASDALRIWTKDGQIAHSGRSVDLLWGIDWDYQDNIIITGSAKGNINLWTNKARLMKQIQ